MSIQSKSLIESIKRAVFTAFLVVFTMALSGCGGSAQVVEWEQPTKPTTPQQDIVPVEDDFECTGIFPCRDQFAAIVESKVVSGDITLNNHETYVLDITTNFTVSVVDITTNINAPYDKAIPHGYLVGSIVETYGSGAKVNYSLQIGNDIGVWRIPKKPFNVIVNQSLGHAFGRNEFSYHQFEGRNAIIVQATGNEVQGNSSHCHNSDCWLVHEKIAQTGRLIMVTGHNIIGSKLSPFGFSKCGKVEHYCISTQGDDISLTFRDEEYYFGGTSGAAPLVTSALQLLSAMWSYLSQERLVQLVLALAEDQGRSGIDSTWGHGILSFRKLFTQKGLMGFKCNVATCVDTNTYS